MTIQSDEQIHFFTVKKNSKRKRNQERPRMLNKESKKKM